MSTRRSEINLLDDAKAVKAAFTRIAFTSNRALDGSDGTNAAYNIWLIDANGAGLKRVTNGANASAFAPQWSYDGTRLVFMSQRKLDGSDANISDTIKNIWTVNADGSGLKPITNDLMATSYAPKWSPNGEQIIFLSYRSLDGTDSAIAGANIWVVNTDGSDLKPLTHTTAKDVVDAQNAQWSPDGKHVAFISSQTQDNVNATGASNIWVVDANGTNLHSVVTSAASTVGAFCL